ncbi:MAG: flagellar protein FlaG [Humidesulfovibrio sp.]|nr:flagellar protein FlaG [Humidesulfovibrio sp.]
MNINPSDMDVRQGYTPAEIAAAASSAPVAQKTPDRGTAQTPEVDPKSQAAIAAADKTVALETADKISQQLADSHTSLKIKLLDNTQDGVQVEIIDKTSQKVLRKIPQDELIKLSASIKKMTGVFLPQST